MTSRRVLALVFLLAASCHDGGGAPSADTVADLPHLEDAGSDAAQGDLALDHSVDDVPDADPPDGGRDDVASADVDHCLDPDCVYGDDWAQLTEGVTSVDSLGAYPSSLVVHGREAFPVVADEGGRVFIAAARYGAGRVVVFGHAGHLDGAGQNGSDLPVLVRNAAAWAGGGPGGSIGVASELPGLVDFLTTEGFDVGYAGPESLSDAEVFCLEATHDYSDAELEAITQFVAGGGGLIVGGLAWWWSYSNPDTATDFPGNRLLNTMGVTYTPHADVSTGAVAVGDAPPSVLLHATKALDLLLLSQEGAVALSVEEKALGAQQAGAAIDLLPLSFSDFFTKAALFRETVGSVIPTPDDPVEKAVDWAEVLAVHLDVRLASELPPDELEAHPAAAAFPGLPDAGAVAADWTGAIDGDHAGLNALFQSAGATARARRGTGRYAPPGAVITVGISPEHAGMGLEVLIGAHSDEVWGQDAWHRMPRIVRSFPLDAAAIEASSAFGGPIYITVPADATLGPVDVQVFGGIPMARYLHGETTPEDWVGEIRDRPAPWAELESDRFIATIPAAEARSLDDPGAVMDFWDAVLDADADLAGIPHARPRAERIVGDVQISVGWLHSGYPIMGYMEPVSTFTDLSTLSETGSWGIFHELGHNHQWGAWVFQGTVESTVNLWSIYAMEEVVGLSRDLAHPAIAPEKRQERLEDYLAGGADYADWSVWVALETYLQLQEAFGWAPFTAVFEDYYGLPLSQSPWEDPGKIDLWVTSFAAEVGLDLGPFFSTWGLPVSDAALDLISDLPAWADDPMAAYR